VGDDGAVCAQVTAGSCGGAAGLVGDVALSKVVVICASPDGWSVVVERECCGLAWWMVGTGPCCGGPCVGVRARLRVCPAVWCVGSAHGSLFVGRVVPAASRDRAASPHVCREPGL